MLGGGAMYAPDYEGSNDYKVLPIPIVEVSWRDRVRLTTKGNRESWSLRSPMMQ